MMSFEERVFSREKGTLCCSVAESDQLSSCDCHLQVGFNANHLEPSLMRCATRLGGHPMPVFGHLLSRLRSGRHAAAVVMIVRPSHSTGAESGEASGSKTC